MSRSRIACAAFFVGAGTLHFVIPRRYEATMPPWLPAHRESVVVSGVAEIAGGLALLVPGLERPARAWLVALLIAVFPANVHMALNPDEIDGLNVPRPLLWARLPLQAALVAWVLRAARAPHPPRAG